MNLLVSFEQLDDQIANSKKIIIYGAGRIAYSLLIHISNTDLDLMKIFCIAVSDTKYNPDRVMGIPVCGIGDLDGSDCDLAVIAAFEKSHEDIKKCLAAAGYSNICAISNMLYALLRQKESDLSTDILNNTQWIRDDICRLREDIRRSQESETEQRESYVFSSNLSTSRIERRLPVISINTKILVFANKSREQIILFLNRYSDAQLYVACSKELYENIRKEYPNVHYLLTDMNGDFGKVKRVVFDEIDVFAEKDSADRLDDSLRIISGLKYRFLNCITDNGYFHVLERRKR